MIAIINYGIGNIGSIENMLKKLNIKSIVTDRREIIESADKLILPGVGSFDTAMKKLKESGISDVIVKQVRRCGKPILGICLGMQILGRGSEEGKEEGLSLIPFYCRRFNFSNNNDDDLKIPHIGWEITKISKENLLLEKLDTYQRYYYVHSYHAVCDQKEDILMTCTYGYEFTAAVNSGNIYGVQFHPEKSHKFGIALFDNFANKV